MPAMPDLSAIESDPRLDGVGGALRRLGAPLSKGTIGSVLRGEWLGHALHPALTDIPIGCWTSSFVLDVVGGKQGRRSAQRLIGLGLLSVAPTAAAGIVDYSTIEDRQSRGLGAVHAVANTLAATMYFFSWRARRRDQHFAGVLLGIAGATAATVGGYLGGHLAFASGDQPTDDAGHHEMSQVVPLA